MDKVITYNRHNAEIEIIVEDGLITTARVFEDGECVGYSEVSSETHTDGIPFTEENFDKVCDLVNKSVDTMFAESFATA